MNKAPRKLPGIENRAHRRRGGELWWTFRVRWTDPRTGRRLSEQFDDQLDAADFLAHLRLAERRGVLVEIDMGRRPLAEFTAEWWERYAGLNLERSTLRTYAVVWNRHLLPRVGHLELRQLTPGAVARLRADLEADGVGPATIRKALGLLQAICRQAVEWEELRANPVKQIRKPPRHASSRSARSGPRRSSRCAPRCRAPEMRR